MAKLTETEEEVIWRRGGPGWNYPCLRPNVVECAHHRCQVANCCELSTAFPGNYNAGRLALDGGRSDG